LGSENEFERCFDNRVGQIRSVIARSRRDDDYSFRGWADGDCGYGDFMG
jgi:hypothetical protein